MWCRRAPGTTRPAGWPAATVAMGSTCRPKLPVTCLGSNTGATAVPRDPAASRHSGRWGRPNLDSLARGLLIEVSPQRREQRPGITISPISSDPPEATMNPEPLVLVGTVALIALCAVTAILARVLVVPAPPRRGPARGPDGRFARTPRPRRRRRLDQSGRVEVVRPPAWASAPAPQPQQPHEARPSTPRQGPQLDSPPDPHSVRGMERSARR